MAFYVDITRAVRSYVVAGPDLIRMVDTGAVFIPDGSRLFATREGADSFASGISAALAGIGYNEAVRSFSAKNATLAENFSNGWATCGGIRRTS